GALPLGLRRRAAVGLSPRRPARHPFLARFSFLPRHPSAKSVRKDGAECHTGRPRPVSRVTAGFPPAWKDALVSTIAFVNVAMHGHINPTLPVVAELSRRGHAVSYHTPASYAPGIGAAGATSYLYAGQTRALPQHPTALNMLESLVVASQQYLPALLDDLRAIQPDLLI